MAAWAGGQVRRDLRGMSVCMLEHGGPLAGSGGWGGGGERATAGYTRDHKKRSASYICYYASALLPLPLPFLSLLGWCTSVPFSTPH